MPHNGGGMASKGLRVITYQVTRKIEAGYNPSHTTETLIGYTRVRARNLFIFNHFAQIYCYKTLVLSVI